jgi:hypothetical protein
MRKLKDVSNPPILWRYFLEVPENKLEFQSERDYVTKTVMKINSDIEGAFVVSGGGLMKMSNIQVSFPLLICRFLFLL